MYLWLFNYFCFLLNKQNRHVSLFDSASYVNHIDILEINNNIEIISISLKNNNKSYMKEILKFDSKLDFKVLYLCSRMSIPNNNVLRRPTIYSALMACKRTVANALVRFVTIRNLKSILSQNVPREENRTFLSKIATIEIV
jgi:hypothetical protein